MAYKSNRIEFECEYCGGKCSQPSSQYNRNKHHFCGKNCTNNWKHGENNPVYNSVQCYCDCCGREFLMPASRVERAKYHYCSKNCSNKGHSIHWLGKKLVDHITTKCDNCGKEYDLTENGYNRGKYHFCSVICRKKGMVKMGAFAKENNPRWTDNDNIIKCKECNKEVGLPGHRYNSVMKRNKHGFFCSVKCRSEWMSKNWIGELNPHYGAIRNHVRGKNNHWWNNGNTVLLRTIRRSAAYYRWKQACLKRDNKECVICRDNLVIMVHHKTPFLDLLNRNNVKKPNEAIGCDDLWNIKHGATLCKKHHNEFHKKYGKYNFTEEDYYEWNKIKVAC